MALTHGGTARIYREKSSQQYMTPEPFGPHVPATRVVPGGGVNLQVLPAAFPEHGAVPVGMV